MSSTRSKAILLIIEILLIIAGVLFLWHKLFLPILYYTIAILLAITIASQVTFRHSSLAIQVFLLFLFLNLIYYVATNFRIIPFWDGNWDFAVTTKFMDDGRIYKIPYTDPPVNFGDYPAKILSIYSGWPLLHTLTLILSKVTGINLFLLSQLLPFLISFASFLFVYLIIEKFGSSLKLGTQAINLAILLYVTSAEALFYPMQFVQQNFGLTLFYAVLYGFYMSKHGKVDSRKYYALTLLFVIALIISHHFTSAIMITLFFLFELVINFQRLLGEFKAKNSAWKINTIPTISVFVLAIFSSVFLFLWWGWGEFATTYVWRKLSATIIRSFELFTGTQTIIYLPSAYYPESLRPPSVILLLTIRDVFTYVLAIFGLFVVIFKARVSVNQYDRVFIILLSFATGITFILNYLFFRIEIFRILIIALPLIVLLSSTSLIYLPGKKKRKLIVGIVSFTLIFSALIGLWGHRFAPLHLYNPDMNLLDVGERYTDVLRIYHFFNQKVEVDHFQAIWTDDSAAIISLLKSKDYSKVMFLNYDFIAMHSIKRFQYDELVCELHNFNTYRYFTGGATSTSPDEGEFMRQEMTNYLQNNVMGIRIFDDGKYRFWIYRGG